MNNFEYLIHQLGNETSRRHVNPRALMACLDLTSLNISDDEVVIDHLCQRALKYQVAAVCVYPAFVPQAVAALKGSSIKVATVANFPQGLQPLKEVQSTMTQALNAGAQECDVVIPYQTFLENHDTKMLQSFVGNCKELMPHQCLKIILETGAFHDRELLEDAALACLEGGANFLKTSTGKISQGASLITAAILLQAIQRYGDMSRGFKASGGVRDYEQAKMYYLLGQMMIGESWPKPHTFRIGASSLLDDIARHMDQD